ncbi:MAG TPA: right-handed parallel beta-helix repeat-containing protein [Gaiellaceae bacterium]|nr:right-handed parallel beta-helix repeat-containing protein [Gaiellaceae bacterium]
MSYTLTGRIQSRLVATLPPLAVALAIHRWWAIVLVGLMLIFGVALDVCVYDRVLEYQPGWLALPLGALELGLIVLAMRMPVTWPALGLFALGWGTAQLCGHALFPRFQLEYAQGGGELGRLGAVLAASVAAVVLAGVAGAVAVIPPTVHLHGVVQGPLVIRHAQTLVGGTVRGGILIRADHVTLKDVTVVGGENGIDIDGADHVMLDGVHVLGVTLDGIHVRRAAVMIEDCHVSAPGGPWVQGIDISFAMDKSMSMVEGCTISGVREGIVTHWTMADLKHNHVSNTTLRGIDMGEMSMGTIAHNTVVDSKGVGILCLDHSECTIERNTISGAAQPIQEQFFAHAELHKNTID